MHSRIVAAVASVVLFVLEVPAARAALTVTAVSPANVANGVQPAAPIVVTFGQALNPATVIPAAFVVTGRFSGIVPVTLTLDAAATHVTLAPQRPYFIAEAVALRIASSVTSVTNQPLSGGFHSLFFVKGGVGSKNFQLVDTIEFREPGEGGTRLYGFNALDVDGDGSPDMSGTNEVSNDVRLKRNDGCGHFGASQIVPMPGGSEPSPNDTADFDGDGRADLVTGNQNGDSVALFKNDGSGGYFAPTITAVGGSCHGVCALDIDGDGDVDVAAANLADVRILRNDGTGAFTDIGGVDGGGSGEWPVCAVDSNADGRADLYVGNYYSGTIGSVVSTGGGNFVLQTTKTAGATAWAIAAGDVNGDGFPDAMVCDNQNGNAILVRGSGTGGFMPATTTYPVGTQPVSARLADLDGDSDLDFSAACYGSANCHIYWNQGGTFVAGPVLDAQQSGSCSVLVDYDRDGDTDVIVTDELSDEAYVYRQIGPNPAGVQPPSCEATLRVDNSALRAGFGTIAAQPLTLGATAFLGVSGAAAQPYALFLGVGTAPGSNTGAGLFNLAVGGPLVTVIAFGGGLTTNAFGEAMIAAPIPLGVPTGIPVALQGAVGAPGSALGATFTNPETIVLVP